MEQFFRAKQEYADAILFFRMGDFYEMFFEDAVAASAMLELTLTSRGTDTDGVAIPMCGVPYHAAAGYIARLLDQGQRVAMCEQMEDPSKVKGVVPREVVRVVTPALALDPDSVDARRQNYLAAVVFAESTCALAVFELGAAEVRAAEFGSDAELFAELVRTEPREILAHRPSEAFLRTLGLLLPRAVLRTLEDAAVAAAEHEPRVTAVLEACAADAPGLKAGKAVKLKSPLAAAATASPPLGAAAALAVRLTLKYTLDAQPGIPLDVQRIVPYDATHQLALDEAAVRNLELTTTLAGERKGSLLHLLDVTQTSMGARSLRRRVLAPLTQIEAIRRRHDAVQAFVDDSELRRRVRAELSRIADLERLATRASLGIATPRDLGAIRTSLKQAEALLGLFSETGSALDESLARLVQGASDDLSRELYAELNAALLDELPLTVTTGGMFRDSHDPRIAELRDLSTGGKDVILRLEQRERERTSISTLKIRYTRVFGYYIEITRSKADRVPADYRRKQTVAGGERFTTEELDDVAAKILNADERLRGLEAELFTELRARVGSQATRLRRLAERIAEIDVHAALADIASRYDYVRPVVDDSLTLNLAEARHPIVERVVASGAFVPNDVVLDADGARLMVITGPNMAGKSTTMRQTALAVIMAQAGSFVPAHSAHIGICDRIYTRVGASDNLAGGQSTFMVEMRETANILRGATRRSLVILDEVGRGTSTYDGLSIAWAVAEYLHDVIQCRGMFATHYHELCDLAEVRSGVVNFNVAAREHGEQVIFLHRLVPGGANRSYGVAVARLSGVPEVVLARSRAILRELEGAGGTGPHARVKVDSGTKQLDMFGLQPTAVSSACEATLRELDVDRMTPVDALVALARLKSLLSPK
ncbi:MAG TPA: DNA mismatch repair protein MutS [Polyangiales bacterium]|jgi:DNA mismatch repair protein MutS|nr:DNA mismatch repair protein MutS [Polyangiales bacterium]